MSSDPWSAASYTSDTNGAASVALTVPRFATTEGLATAYHALVIDRSYHLLKIPCLVGFTTRDIRVYFIIWKRNFKIKKVIIIILVFC